MAEGVKLCYTDTHTAERDICVMKKRMQIMLFCMAAVLTAACGNEPSKEKVMEVQEAYAELVNCHNEVIEAYADVKDDSLSKELDEMSEKINSIGQQDAKELTNEELDAIKKELKESIEIYDGIMDSIGQLKEKETNEKIYSIPVTIRNNTGIKLFQMYLYPASETNKGDNLVEDIGYLDGYQTRNILNLYMNEDEMLWRLEALDEDGNMIESADIDFTGFGEDGVTLKMEFSFDSMEGWIVTE